MTNNAVRNNGVQDVTLDLKDLTISWENINMKKKKGAILQMQHVLSSKMGKKYPQTERMLLVLNLMLSENKEIDPTGKRLK